jgi:hypothetical protein
MNIKDLISEIKDFLDITFKQIDLWFEKDLETRCYRPRDGGWSIDQILEHIGLTNHFLLILIDKGTNKALANSAKLEISEELKNYEFNREKLIEIGLHKSFNWIRPEHMEPRAEKTLEQVRQQLKDQLQQSTKSPSQPAHPIHQQSSKSPPPSPPPPQLSQYKYNGLVNCHCITTHPNNIFRFYQNH